MANDPIGNLGNLMFIMMVSSMAKPVAFPQVGQRTNKPVKGINCSGAPTMMTGQEKELRKRYGSKVGGWKRKSLEGYSKSLDKKWDNWFREMAK